MSLFFIPQHLERLICFSFQYLYYPLRLQLMTVRLSTTLPYPQMPLKMLLVRSQINKLRNEYDFVFILLRLSSHCWHYMTWHYWPLAFFLGHYTPTFPLIYCCLFCCCCQCHLLTPVFVHIALQQFPRVLFCPPPPPFLLYIAPWVILTSPLACASASLLESPKPLYLFFFN